MLIEELADVVVAVFCLLLGLMAGVLVTLYVKGGRHDA